METIFSKLVVIRDPKLRKVRDNLRKLFLIFTENEYNRLTSLCNIYLSKINLTNSQMKRFKAVREERYMLYRALTHSICLCAVCSSSIKDMDYVPSGKCWICVDCLDSIKENKKKKEII